MKKKLLSVLLCTAMVATLAVGCGSGNNDSGADSGSSSEATDDAGDDAEEAGDEGGESGSGTYAIVTKSAGNPFNEKTADGFQEEIGRAHV